MKLTSFFRAVRKGYHPSFSRRGDRHVSFIQANKRQERGNTSTSIRRDETLWHIHLLFQTQNDTYRDLYMLMTGKYVFNNTDEEYYLCRKNYQYGTPDDKTTYVKAIAPHSATSVPMEIDGWFHPFPTRISYHHGRGPDAVDDHDKNLYYIFTKSQFDKIFSK